MGQEGKRKLYDERELQEAADSYIDGMKMKDVRIKYSHIPERTIRTVVNRKRNGIIKQRPGPKPVLGQIEEVLKDWVLLQQRSGVSLTREKLLTQGNKLYKEFLEKEEMENEQDENNYTKKKCTLTSTWVRRFMDRHPELQYHSGSQQENRPHVLLCATGSVATVKIPELAVKLCEFAEVKIILSNAANFFLDRAQEYNPFIWGQYIAMKDQGRVCTLTDEDEWNNWNRIGDPVLHVELKDWANVLVIAPLSANSLAKLANGIADNLITCTARAWKITKPVVYAPAMNTDMWNHPITSKQLDILNSYSNYYQISPIAKKLACGDVGIGGLAPVSEIIEQVRISLNLPDEKEMSESSSTSS